MVISYLQVFLPPEWAVIEAERHFTVINIPIDNDEATETEGTITVTVLTNPSGSHASTSITIKDDDSTPRLTIANASGNEGTGSNESDDGSVTFMPTLSVAAVQDVVITYYTSSTGTGLTSASADDYTAVTEASNTSVTIPAGQTTPSTPLSITTSADDDAEFDETFTLHYTATNVKNTAERTATGTISNDDKRAFHISTPANIAEGHSGTKQLEFTVTLGGGTAEQMETVRYRTVATAEAKLSGSGHAQAGSDFTAVVPDDNDVAANTLTFDLGTTTNTISIEILGDMSYEADFFEKFDVELYGNDTARTELLNDGRANWYN